MDRSRWIRTCPICGKEFSSPRWGARYCSDDCRREVERRRGRLRAERRAAAKGLQTLTKRCPRCGATFQTRKQYAVYCADCIAVRLAEMKRQFRERGKRIAVCETCGAEFERTHPSIKNCEDCRAVMYGRKVLNKPSRRCHDCGKACSDYRCPECWAALRKRLGIPAELEDEDDMEDLT